MAGLVTQLRSIRSQFLTAPELDEAGRAGAADGFYLEGCSSLRHSSTKSGTAAYVHKQTQLELVYALDITSTMPTIRVHVQGTLELRILHVDVPACSPNSIIIHQLDNVPPRKLTTSTVDNLDNRQKNM